VLRNSILRHHYVKRTQHTSLAGSLKAIKTFFRFLRGRMEKRMCGINMNCSRQTSRSVNKALLSLIVSKTVTRKITLD